MEPKTNLIIADGHHRYETALNYQREMTAKHPDAPPNAGFHYRMVALVSMSDSGLIVLPTHRLIFNYQQLPIGEILNKARKYFQVQEIKDRASLEAEMDQGAGRIGQIGLVSQDGIYLLILKDHQIMADLAPDRVQAWRDLDVSILHLLILDHIMDVDQKAIDNLENIKYLREPDLGYQEVSQSEGALLFILNATRIDQVTACTEAGEKMPQKSTDFYPKIVTGFAMLPVQPHELL
jgi:uncharacterized protein (DUF1015 family)